MSNSQFALTNYMEDAVRLVLEEMLQNEAYQGKTIDDGIKMDAMAYALNRLPPKYVASKRGHIYTRVQELRQQFKTDIVVELTKALRLVLSNPRR